MRKQTISAAKRLRVARASSFRCGYCLTTQRVIGPLLEIDHIVPESRGGADDDLNLTLACPLCNSYKSDKVSATDPTTGEIVALFHPRLDQWQEHFEWIGGYTVIQGKTAKGRATLDALRMNHPDTVTARHLWVMAGWHPPALEDSE